MLGAFERYRSMRADAEMARLLGVQPSTATFDDLPAGFVNWCRDFKAMEDAQ